MMNGVLSASENKKKHFNGCTNDLTEVRETEAQSGGEGLCEAVTLRQYSPKHLKTLVGGASQSIHKDPSNFPTKNSGMWSPQQKR